MRMFLNWQTIVGTGPTDWIGVEAGANGVAFAHLGFGSGEPPYLHHCEFLAGQSGQAALADLVTRRRPGRSPCNWVLGSRDYNLLLLEAPKVPAEELRDALRWQIKDLVSFPADQAVLDIFELPEDGSRGRHMIYAAAAPRGHIEGIVASARQARLKLSSIDIGEFALRNIADEIPSDGRGVAVVRIQRERGSIVLLRNGQLYLSRQFELAYGGASDEALPEDALILELQRSLDYYERQMAQEAPGRILLCGDNIAAEKITENMRSGLTSSLEHLPLGGLFANGDTFEEAQLQRCVGAIGAALRGRVG